MKSNCFFIRSSITQTVLINRSRRLAGFWYSQWLRHSIQRQMVHKYKHIDARDWAQPRVEAW